MRRYYPSNSDRLYAVVKYLIVAGILLSHPVRLPAATYYLDADGSDSADGLSAETPWRTIGKINSLRSSETAGSTFLLKRGDVFSGEIRLAGYTDNVKFAAYGEGEKPIVSGSVVITGWSKYSGNIYAADISGVIGVDQSISQLFINNRRVLLARYPNVENLVPDPDEGWLEVDSSSNKRTFTDPFLGAYKTADKNWVGGNVRIRSFSWLFETRKITSVNGGGTVVMDSDLTETLASYIQRGWGYYIDNILDELDHENEYYFDDSTRTIYLYAPGGVDPNSVLVEGSIYSRGCWFDWHYSKMTVEDLTFRHQQDDGIYIENCPGVSISNCRFDNIGHVGVNAAWRATDLVVENCQFSDILEFGIKVISDQPAGNNLIQGNTVRNTGVIAGYGGSGVARACGIRTWGVTGLHISKNIIEDTGYAGIHLEGGGHLVSNNVIRRSMLTLDDGGGLFINSPDNTIRGNIVTDTWGNRGPSSGEHNGSSFDNNQMGMGIFFQPSLSGNIVENNTFANNSSQGIYPDRARNTNIISNISYNNGSGAYQGAQLYLRGSGGTAHNIQMTGNILVGTRGDQYSMRTDSSYNIGSYDNDVHCNLETAAAIRDGSLTLTLEQWQASGINRDSDATECPQMTSGVSRILINSTDTAADFLLGDIFFDHKGNVLGPSANVSPYSSVIVFQEQSSFYSVGKLILILQLLAGDVGPAPAILDINQDSAVTLADALVLFNRLKE